MLSPTRIACEECGDTAPIPQHMHYVFRQGSCPSCGIWMEAEFLGGRMTSGVNVVEVTNKKEVSHD